MLAEELGEVAPGPLTQNPGGRVRSDQVEIGGKSILGRECGRGDVIDSESSWPA